MAHEQQLPTIITMSNNDLFTDTDNQTAKAAWMKRNHITVKHRQDESEPFYESFHGMKCLTTKPTEEAALIKAARILKIKLWNEQ